MLVEFLVQSHLCNFRVTLFFLKNQNVSNAGNRCRVVPILIIHMLVIKSHGFYVNYPVLEDQFFVFMGIFMKIRSFYMVSIPEQFVIRVDYNGVCMGDKKADTKEASKKISNPKLELKKLSKISSNEKVSPLPVTTIFERKLFAFISPFLYIESKSIFWTFWGEFGHCAWPC